MIYNYTLSIFLWIQDEDGINKLIASHVGDQGRRWHRGVAYAGSQNFILLFESTGTEYPRSEVAIDDVSISNCDLLGKFKYKFC